MIKCALHYKRKSNQHCPNDYFTIILQQIKSSQIKCRFVMTGENRSTRGKTSQSRVENQQTQSTYDAECGNRTQATLMEGKCSHHYAISLPQIPSDKFRVILRVEPTTVSVLVLMFPVA